MKSQLLPIRLFDFPVVMYKLIRFPNLAIMAFTQFFVAIFLIGPTSDWLGIITKPSLNLLVWSTACIAAAGYIINDYYDVKIDIINKPDRLIIGRSISRRYAMALHLVFNFVGLFLAWQISYNILVLHLFSVFLLWWYSNFLKRQAIWGNLVVSILTGFSVLAVAVLFKQSELLVAIYALFALVMSFIRELIKDMEDMKGDKNYGCQTAPIRFGLRFSKRIIYWVVALLVVLLLSFGLWYKPFMVFVFIVLIIIPLGVFLKKLSQADTKKDFSFLSKFCKGLMISGILSMIFI
jgi:4-hydroxybenzoate polyprenyltransferase